tara:strand:- start:6242 stop:7288 length:1047 start_codon:yes stop_codon:yes gene_type:complete
MAFTTVNKSTDYFNTKLYTGTGSSNAQTGIGFQPDMVWFKSRSAATDHALFDAVRGVTKEIRPNKSDYEDTASNGLTAFDSDGFTIGDWSVINDNSATYVSWNWKANGQGSSNGDGSITTTYTSANTTSGVSIIQYTGNGSDGATIGHGLGVAPTFLITKKTSGAESWYVGSSGLTSWDYKVYLDTADAQSTNSPSVWGGAAPTSSTISLGNSAPTNASGQTYIMYAFAPITGFSSYGSYIGNGNADGPFVYTGFKPAFILGKNADTGSQHWFMNDNKRLGYNGSSAWIKADSNSAELTNLVNCDFLSNGFKVRNADSIFNQSGVSQIYMAFAEAPLVGSNNIAANAR